MIVPTRNATRSRFPRGRRPIVAGRDRALSPYSQSTVGSSAMAVYSAIAAMLVLGSPAIAAENRISLPEEMLVVGDPNTAMDVLAGATTTRIDAGVRLLEGVGLDDLLAEVPGVQIRRFGGTGEPFEISIRGSSPQQVPVFLDGVRIESALTSRSDLSVLCLDVLDEIQVTRGPGAARYGSGAIGGVVNLVSRTPSAEQETRIRGAVGNFGTGEGSLRHTRRIGDWGASLAYCGFHTEGDFKFQRVRPSPGGGSSPIEPRANNQADRHTGILRLDREIGGTRLGLTQLVNHLDRGTPGSDSNQRFFAEEQNLSLLTIARLDGELPPILGGHGASVGNFEALLAHRYERNDFRDPEITPGQDLIDTETQVHSLTPRLGIRKSFDTKIARLETGLLAEGRFETRSSNEANRKSRAGMSIRAELTSHWLDDRLRISPSLRFERFGGLDSEWIPGLFMEADLLDWLRLKASASRSYRAPSFGELYLPDKGFERGNENLKAEVAWNFEAGLIAKSPFESPWLDFEFEATWFGGEVDDSIVFQQISRNTFSYENTGRVETRGHEVSLRWRPHDWVRLTASRTVTDAKSEENGSSVAGIARSQIDGRLEFGPREFWKLSGEVQYTGRLPVSPGDLVELSSRVVWGGSASIDLAQLKPLPLPPNLQSLWLSLRARNLGNIAVRDTGFSPRPGRNFTLALEGAF